MKATVTKVDKPWGHELIWAKTGDYVGKIRRVDVVHPPVDRSFPRGLPVAENVLEITGPLNFAGDRRPVPDDVLGGAQHGRHLPEIWLSSLPPSYVVPLQTCNFTLYDKVKLPTT